MGNLSNLYISQSYISLIHLGSDNTASTSLTQLQDGLGNGIGIYVNTNGDLANTGNVTVGRSLTVSGSARINTAYTSSTPTYVNSGNQYTDNIIRITGSYASGSPTSPTLNEVQIGWPIYGPGLVSGALVTNTTFIPATGWEFTINQNTAVWFGNYYFTNPTTFYDNTSISGSEDITGSLWVRDNITTTNLSASNAISASDLWVKNTIHAYKLDVTIESSSIIFTSGSNIIGDEANVDTQTLIGRVIVSGSLEVTGSTRLNGNTTISGSTLLSGSTTITGSTNISGSTIISGSTTISGSNNLIGINSLNGTTNITGSLNVTGSMIYSGSVRGVVVPLVITSNTASMDCSSGNFFTLTLPTSSIVLNPTNILPGDTISLKITQAASGNGKLIFPSNVKFPALTPYSGSSTFISTDIVSLISYDTTTLWAVQVKNLI